MSELPSFFYSRKKCEIGLPAKREIGYNIRNRNKSFFYCRTKSFKNSFFPYTIKHWYSLDSSVINSNLLEVFKSKLLAFIRPVQRSIYDVFNPQGLKFLTRLRLGLGHLNEGRFRHNFKDSINPLCSSSLEVENKLYFFLHCQHYSIFRMGLMKKVNQIAENFSCFSDDSKVRLLLYVVSRFDDNRSNFIFSASITYILETERFSTSLLQSDV